MVVCVAGWFMVTAEEVTVIAWNLIVQIETHYKKVYELSLRGSELQRFFVCYVFELGEEQRYSDSNHKDKRSLSIDLAPFFSIDLFLILI